MSPTKLMYTIKTRIDEQIDDGNGKTQTEDDKTGVDKNRNFHRFKDSYIIGSRAYNEPLPEIVEGSQYTRNVEIIGKMLQHHAEFQEAMNRKVQIVAQGEEINTASMNPVMMAKVADVITQIDEVNSPN